MARCRSCGDPIVWVKTVSGKANPLIADLETGEPLAFVDNGSAGRVQLDSEARQLDGTVDRTVKMLRAGQEADPDKPIWLTHFVDCPHAERWRRGVRYRRPRG